MSPKTLLAFTLILSFSSRIFSQNKAEKWGDVPAADLAMTVYPEDSAAAAVILQDVGSVQLQTISKYLVIFKQHRRIKVFDVKAFKEGNLMIPYYALDGYEKLTDLDVQLILPNGEKRKIKSDNVFTEKISRFWSAKKVFIPNLQKGCIIEYRFEISSETPQILHDWYFQHELPVRWSELSVQIPPYFNYVLLMRLPHAFDLQETSKVVNDSYNRYGLAHLPAIREEPFITTLDDYRAHIGFQLATVNFPGQNEQKFMTDWSELAKEMEKWDGFGDQYRRERKSDDLWAAFETRLRPGAPADTIARQVLRFVSDHIKWDETYSYVAESSLDEAFHQKSGNSAEINLAVVALLRRAGLDAVPMLVSTRGNGETYDQYPFREQFNSVVAYLRKPGGGVALDATNPFLPVGQLRTPYYNKAGWLVDPEKPFWENLPAPEAGETWFGQLRLDETGALSGRFTISLTGALAYQWRSALSHDSGEELLKDNFATDYPGIRFDSIATVAREDFDKPLQVKFYCTVPNAANVVNDFIYCRPVLDFFVNENPFKSLQRSFPVDFPYPVKMNYVVNLQLPAGYTVEELPEAARIALPDEAGKIGFSCSKSNARMVQLQLRMNLAKMTFLPGEYPALRKFFDLVAEKTQLQLVLKKE